MGHRSARHSVSHQPRHVFAQANASYGLLQKWPHANAEAHTHVKEEEITVLALLSSPQEYQIDIIFAQTWVDTRLRYNSSSTRMPTLTLNRWRLRMSRMFGGEKQSAASYRDTGYRTRSRPRRRNVSLSSPPPLSGIFTLRISHWRTKFLPLTGGGP